MRRRPLRREPPGRRVRAGACGQVLLYDPHDELQVTTTSGAPPLRTLNFNKTITALDAGPLDPARTRAQAKLLEVSRPTRTMTRSYEMCYSSVLGVR